MVKTVSVSTVVVKQQRAGRRRAREIRSWEEPAITEDNAPDMSETAPSLNENLEERSELDERSAVEERQAIPTPNLESLRNLCPACPANATLVTSGRTAELSYCCPPRRTITQTKTIVARIVTKTAFQKSAVLRTRTVTKVVPYIVAATQTVRVQIFRDINSNGVYDASQDLPIVGTAVELLKLGGGSATQLDNGTTAADGTVDFLTDRIVAFDNLAVAYLGNGTVLTTIQVGSNGKLPAGTTIPVVVATGPLPGTTTKTHTISATSRTNTVTKSLTATATAATSTATHTKSLTSTASKSATTTTPLVVPDPLSVWQIQDGCFPNFFEERLPNAGNSPDAAYRSCYPSCDRESPFVPSGSIGIKSIIPFARPRNQNRMLPPIHREQRNRGNL